MEKIKNCAPQKSVSRHDRVYNRPFDRYKWAKGASSGRAEIDNEQFRSPSAASRGGKAVFEIGTESEEGAAAQTGSEKDRAQEARAPAESDRCVLSGDTTLFLADHLGRVMAAWRRGGSADRAGGWLCLHDSARL
ncbi:hypothetical protein M8744_06775 [Lutimaribacter sp. EGI FJ00013]|uniref:Uncharacterized protein n=1 Tax=Lutimaribacter degradans TaxID=2945989 RepID=A0ACC5ZUW8_9RHOB|nr:hypothetical protein [Lutimaribacter sp. EGI FJ00013]MCM2561841.1 hypothetical protein [Lutimaribacter sp. EGI FJ00013]